MNKPSSVSELFRIVNGPMQSKIKTRDGRSVMLTRFEIWDDAPFHGIIEGEDKERYWLSDGNATLSVMRGEHPLDLIIDPEREHDAPE